MGFVNKSLCFDNAENTNDLKRYNTVNTRYVWLEPKELSYQNPSYSCGHISALRFHNACVR